MKRILFVATSLFSVFTVQACAVDLKPGSEFQDCKDCPVMVILPRGDFIMGARKGDKPDYMYEQAAPLHKVTIDYDLAVGKYELTIGEYKKCIADKACSVPAYALKGFSCITSGKYKGACVKAPSVDPSWDDDPRRPVTEANWYQAQEYIEWLSKKTGHSYRLPSEAEWEYAARGGTDTRYWWGDEGKKGMANCGDCINNEFRNKYQSLNYLPVGLFPANPFGLYDVVGNANEWVEDCFIHGYKEAPVDGLARLKENDCPMRAARGGGGDFQKMQNISLARRVGGNILKSRFGFRIALTLNNKSNFSNIKRGK